MKVLVAMSGGVDSSVAAALVTQAGHEAIGVFMRLGSPGERLDSGEARIRHRGCCSIGDADDARRVAASLDIPFYVVNFRREFGRIMDYFADEYASGRTPNPCVRCNDWLKFGRLHEYARAMGADAVASGHYARIRDSRLCRAADDSKDQTYVLFGLPREQLSTTLFPIGEMPKSEVRALARRLGLPVASKPDSQEICFVPDDDYASLVEARRPDAARRGPILDESGATLGTHAGQHRFTIGQRRGIALALPQAAYVLARDPAANSVTVGPRERLARTACAASEANWHSPPPASPGEWFSCSAKYRYNTRACAARARVLADSTGPTPSGRPGRFEVRFDQPQDAVAPGQAIVLYDASSPARVIAGGWIEAAT